MRAHLTDSKIIDSLFILMLNFHSDRSPLLDPSFYHTVGSLVYLTIAHPNISHVVHIVSQFVVTFLTQFHILTYFRGTQFQSPLLSFTSSLELRSNFDADWANDPQFIDLTLTFVSFISNPAFLEEQNARYYSRSSTKVNYLNIASTTCETVWLHQLLADMVQIFIDLLHCIVKIKVLF